jgi:phage terminase large subunit-like protein
MAPHSHYDKAAADHAVAFIESLCHTKGEWAGKPFALIDWQERIIRDLFGIIKPNGYRQFTYSYAEIPKKAGKQLSLRTLIPTPNGFVTMGDIDVGDTVYDERGQPCCVIAKSAVDYIESAFRITFKDGEVVEAGANHQWYGQWRDGKQQRVGVVDTGWLYKRSQTFLRLRERPLDFRIKAAAPIQTREADLPIEPYSYGRLLGNGETAEAGIPTQYLRASYAQRQRLWRGLMDSGSDTNKKEQAAFRSTKRKLADDVSELLWSLGVDNAVERAITPSGEMVYSVKPAALDDLEIDSTQSHYRYIDRIEPIPNPGMRCVQVDSPSHQYLVGRSFLPTHNSELAAAVALYMLCADGEQSAEVYGCASDRQQAGIVFETAMQMCRACPALARRVKALASTKRLIYMPTNSVYQVLSSDAFRAHGYNISATIFDELHTQPNRKLFDVMTKGSGDARKQPLFFLITTAGTDTNSICYETHMKALDILEGRKRDPTFYPVIYAAQPDDDWTDPEVWKKANPSLGITVDIEKFHAACESAKQNPGEENSFKTLRLNIWCKQSIRWMPMRIWDACADPVDPDDLEGRVCYGGLDLSSTTDLTAFSLVFPPDGDDGKYLILPYFWVPEDTLDQRVRRDHAPYDLWRKQGFIQTTDGNVVHYGFIERFIERLGERYNIKEIAYDRWNATQVSQNLEGEGFQMIPFGQGFKSMNAPTQDLMRLALSKRIAHGGHPVLRWNMDNVYIRTDPAGNIKPDKQKSTERIDGAVATIMALGRAVLGGNAPQGKSIYDSRGLLFV